MLIELAKGQNSLKVGKLKMGEYFSFLFGLARAQMRCTISQIRYRYSGVNTLKLALGISGFVAQTTNEPIHTIFQIQLNLG